MKIHYWQKDKFKKLKKEKSNIEVSKAKNLTHHILKHLNMSKRSNNLHSQIRINYISFANSKKLMRERPVKLKTIFILIKYFSTILFNISRLLFFQNQSRKKKTTCNNHNL